MVRPMTTILLMRKHTGRIKDRLGLQDRLHLFECSRFLQAISELPVPCLLLYEGTLLILAATDCENVEGKNIGHLCYLVIQ